MSSNPWLSNSRWMKSNKDLEEKSESETGMSNSQNGDCALADGKEMTCLREMKSLRDELQGWKNKCVKMEEEFRTERGKLKRVLILKQTELNKMKGQLGKMAEELEKTQLEKDRLAGKCVKMEEEFRTERDKLKRVLILKQTELNKMKGQLGKMAEELEKTQLEKDSLAAKSNRMDKLIEELAKLGMTRLVGELDRDKHTLSVDENNINSQDCSVSDSKDTGRLVDVGMAVKGKLGEMKPLSEVGLMGVSKKDNISQCQAGVSKKDEVLQCEVGSMSLGKNEKISQCQAGLTKKDKNSQSEFGHVNCNKNDKISQCGVGRMNSCKKDKISQCQGGLMNLGKKEGMMDMRMEVKENLGEIKPHSEIMLTGVGEKDKITGGDNILEDSQRRPHCIITTQLDNRAGKGMLKRVFEDFDKWMGADKEKEVREASPQAKCCKMDKIQPSDDILEAVITKEAKGEEDAELQEVHEEMEVQVRCKRSDGKQWRCSYSALPGRTLCQKHFSHAQQKSCKNRRAGFEWGNAKKHRDISTITECKRSLTIVTRQQQENKEKCRSDDEEEDISDSSEDEPPKKKRNSRVMDEEEKDPDYNPAMRRKQKYDKLESSPIGSVALNAGHENLKKGTCSNDRLTPGRDRWEQIDLVSRDGQMKLSTQVLFASFDQRSERAAGESACSALVAVIADWLHNNRNSMLTKPLFDALIQKGSLQWRNLCQIQAYKQRFPDGHFDLETVLEANVCSLSLAPDKSFVAFFQPEKIGDSFEFLQESTSFDKIWEEIINGTYAREEGTDGPQIYIVTWNDHFFLLKVEKGVCYIIDTLGERLFEGCKQAYILKFDKNTTVYQMGEEEKSSTTSQSASTEISKYNENELQHESAKMLGNTGSIEIVESNNVKGKLICKGRESCKEFIKGFWAALTLRELEIDIKMGLLGRIHPYQRLQIEFHFTCLTSLECIAD
ncbi:hypothetical protein SUGI_0575160 [Cryptomeria japonica]|uniref:uncharacterized protein LOC131066220 n=1 Tax=Cryptomeria japonica TaxID=3369 RepID=UPI002408A8A6|nr:uncharacterized protein LOC131066220 [Cryptomeria japonica]GLJ29171.1 hypothetical protein SUGI_0575160 [Cryptomeria japonica]